MALAWVWWLNRQLKELQRPLTERLRFVPASGHYVDPQTGHGVCPRCLTEGHLTHLQTIGADAFACGACGQAYAPIAR